MQSNYKENACNNFNIFGPEAFDEYEYEDNKAEFLVKERNLLIYYNESKYLTKDGFSMNGKTSKIVLREVYEEESKSKVNDKTAKSHCVKGWQFS